MAERWRDIRNGPVQAWVERKRRPGNVSGIARIVGGANEFGLDPRSLVQFVLISRVDLLSEREYDENDGWVVLDEARRLDRAQLARAIGWTPKSLSLLLGQSTEFAGDGDKRGYRAIRSVGDRLMSSWAAVRHSPRFDASRQVSRLEADLQMFAMRERRATPAALRSLGSVTSFWQEMLGSGESVAFPNVQDARWFRDLLESGPRNSAEALIAGEALLSLLAASRDRCDAERLVNAHRAQVTRAVRALMTVATKPPSRGAVPAIHLLAQLGSLAVQWDDEEHPHTVADLVVEHVRDSPVGFRAVRVLTRIVTLSIRRYGLVPAWWSHNSASERQMVWDALIAIVPLRDRDPYPARSLWVEALRAIQLTKDPKYGEMALGLLEERARTEGRPVRERAYAAYCVYLARRDTEATKVSALLNQTREPGDNELEADKGLLYAADLIERLLHANVPDLTLETLLLDRAEVGEELDDDELSTAVGFSLDYRVAGVDELVFPDHVRSPNDNASVGAVLNRIPDTVRGATQSLIRYSLLSIDGSARRRAAEALREAGVAKEAGCILIQVLKDESLEVWVREHAAFLLGCLADSVAIDPLREAGQRGRHRRIRHAAIWALGDIGHPDEAIVQDLLQIALYRHEESRIVRAATYALAVMHPEPDDGVGKEVRTALEKLVEHKDPLVADLARWGLLTRDRGGARESSTPTAQLWGIDTDLRRTLQST